MQARQLTNEEVTRRLLFIGKCVDTNATIPDTTRFGVARNLTVQDLNNRNTDTLKNIGRALKKIQTESGDDEFGNEEETKISGIPISEWIDYIKLTTTKKLQDQVNQIRDTKIKALQRELEQYKTPGEKRAELERELVALGAIVPPVEQPVTV